MKTDKLERFIIENREAFDDIQPKADLFREIETGKKRKTIHLNWKTIAMRAAAVVVIFISSYYFHDFMQNHNRNTALTVNNDRMNTEQSQMYIELQEASFYYSSQIEETKAIVYRMTGSNADLRREINNELMDLDKVFQELKDDLKDNADNEEVIVAMIQNYRLKLEILKDILNQLKAADEKNNRDEAKQISI
jgi:hypothetical protein